MREEAKMKDRRRQYRVKVGEEEDMIAMMRQERMSPGPHLETESEVPSERRERE